MPVYLVKFLNVELGHYTEIDSKNYIFKMLFNELSSFKGNKHKPTIKPGDMYYKIVLAERFFVRYNKIAIHDDGVNEFIGYVDGLFRKELRTWVDSRTLLKKELELKENKNRLAIKKAILDFMAVYDINDTDFKIESLWKYYQRYKKRKLYEKRLA